MTTPGELSPVAARVRRHRDRRRRGLVPVQIVLFERELDELVRRGLLTRERRNDRREIAEAVGKLLARTLR